MRVVHIQRKKNPERFSIEGYFERVREFLPSTTVQVAVFILPHFSRGFFPRLCNMIAAWQNQADINHVTGDIHYVTLMLNRKQTLLTVHDCEILSRLTGWKRALVRWFWYTLPAKRVAAMTVNSAETKRSLLQVIKFPEDQIHVVPVAISTLYQPAEKAFCAECPRILHIGTKQNKNLLRLAEALQGIKCQVDIVGPPTEPQLDALRLHGIQYTIHLNLTDLELLERYHQSDVVSFVSTHEGFGMPIVEAQSVERACVTSNCSSMPETAGQGACLVDPFDVASIRAGFQKVIADKTYRESLIAQGRINKLRFNTKKIAEDFLTIYEAIREQKLSASKAT
jgi:glycosyltransferase involved in cell wall biosynthesis